LPGIIRLPNEPIVIVSSAPGFGDGLAQQPSVDALIAQLAAKTRHPRLYRITDLRRVHQIDFSDILLWLDVQREYGPGSLRDPRVQWVVVGEHPLLTIAARKIRTNFDLDVPVFATMNEALAFVRAEIARTPRAEHL